MKHVLQSNHVWPEIFKFDFEKTKIKIKNNNNNNFGKII